MKLLGILRSAQAIAPALGLLMCSGCGESTPVVPKPVAQSKAPSLFTVDTSDALPLRPTALQHSSGDSSLESSARLSRGLTGVALDVTNAVLPVIYPVDPLPPIEDVGEHIDAEQINSEQFDAEHSDATSSVESIADDSRRDSIEQAVGPVFDLPDVNDTAADAGQIDPSARDTTATESSERDIVTQLSSIENFPPGNTVPPSNFGGTSVDHDPKLIAEPSVSSEIQQHLFAPNAPIAAPLIANAAVPFGPSEPGPELTAVARRADSHVARGVRLAEKGAMFSARAEFIEALKLVAGAMDAQRGTNAHAQALNAGLKSLEEANDFVSRGTAIDSSLNLTDAIAGHQTPVLKSQSLSGMTPSVALAKYLTYAQEQFGHAGGDLAPAAAAFYGLGKLQSIPSAERQMVDVSSAGKAVVFYQAALIVDRRHYNAANELGVLLARYGRLHEAKSLFLHSVNISPQPVTWKNLAAVHQDLGEVDLAQSAKQESQLATTHLQRSGHALPSGGPQVQWIDPAAFARSGQANADMGAPLSAAPTTSTINPNTTAQKHSKQRSSVKSAARLPWEIPDRK